MIWSTAAHVSDPEVSTLPLALFCCRVSDHPGLGFTAISRSRFERVLDGLLEERVRFLDLEDYCRAVDGEIDGSGLLLAFETAEADFLTTALPVLSERGLPAVLFVATASVGHVLVQGFGPFRRESSFLSWSQLRKLQAAGIRTQSAGHRQIDLRSVPPEVAFGDLIRSRRELEHRLSEEAIALSYPHRSVDEEVADLARRAGFCLAFGSGQGRISDPRFDLPWLKLRPTDSVESILQRSRKLKARRARA